MSTDLTVTQAAESRHSIRKYTGEEITESQIHEIVRLAGHAPSAFNIQTWRVIAVKSQAEKDKLQAAAYGQPQVGAAAVTFVIYSDAEETMAHLMDIAHPGMGEEGMAKFVKVVEGAYGPLGAEMRAHIGVGNSFIFVGYLLLVAQSLGWGTSPMAGFEEAKVKALYNLPDSARVVALVATGRPDEAGFPTHRLPVEKILKTV